MDISTILDMLFRVTLNYYKFWMGLIVSYLALHYRVANYSCRRIVNKLHYMMMHMTFP